MGDLDVTTFVPIAIVAAIFGIIEMIKAAYLNRYGKDSKLPWWFAFAPFGLGLLIGFGHWFVITDTEVILAMSVAKRILNAVYLGLGYGGASTLIYELKKGLLGRNDSSSNSNPTV
jgi:hypothetical protein